MPPTVLIAEDEATVREVLRRYLEREGFQVQEADTGPRALELLYEAPPDLLVLDVMLPGMDGFYLLQTLRQQQGLQALPDMPVIMLTARSEEQDRLEGFERGADDYVTKPFSPRELVMRVKAVLRRTKTLEAPSPATDAAQSLQAGALRLELQSRSVTQGGLPLSLTAKEFDLLLFLMQHPRQVFSRAQLLDRVWGYAFHGDESTVTVHIHRLREKLEADPTLPQYIHTVWGVGYRFEASL